VLLERRIDTLIYRVHWATSFFNARQIINHGHVLVNNKVVTNPSYILNIGDKIEIKKNSFSIIKDNILKNINNIYVNTPSYIEVNYNILTAMFLYNPHYSYIPYPTLRNISLIQNILLK
jgi:small subunit ribosomal protein S4